MISFDAPRRVDTPINPGINPRADAVCRHNLETGLRSLIGVGTSRPTFSRESVMTNTTFARLVRPTPAPQALHAARRTGLVALAALLVLAGAAPAAGHAQTAPPPVAQPTAL